MKIGKIIRKYRKEQDMTQEEMASRLGVSTAAVNKWENDNSYPDITLLAPIEPPFLEELRNNLKKSFADEEVFGFLHDNPDWKHIIE